MMAGRTSSTSQMPFSVRSNRQSYLGASHALWKRAALWRLSAYGGVFCTALLVLFSLPATRRTIQHAETTAHYTVPPVKAPEARSLGPDREQATVPVPKSNGPLTQIAADAHSPANPSEPQTASVIFRSSLGGTIKGDGLTATYCCAGAMSTFRASQSYAAGKYYYEVRLQTAVGAAYPGTWTNAGIVQVGAEVTPARERVSMQVQAIGWGQQKSFKDGDLIGFAVDLDKGQFYFHVNGDWVSGPPERGSGLRLDVGKEYVPFVTVASPSLGASGESDSWVANFGRSQFMFSLPEGYVRYDHVHSERDPPQKMFAGGAGSSLKQTSEQVIVPVMPNASLVSPSPAGMSVAGRMVGRTYSGTVPFKGRQMPLPSGEWVVSAYTMAGVGGDGADAIFLAHIVGQQLAGAVVFIGTESTRKVGTGYRQYGHCLRKNLVHIETRSNEEFGFQECWSINHNDVKAWHQSAEHPLLRAAIGDLAIRHVQLPHTLVSAHFRLADKNGYLNAIYYFNPEEEGISTPPVASWRESDWFVGYINRYPEKVAYVQQLKVWGSGWFQKLKASFLEKS